MVEFNARGGALLAVALSAAGCAGSYPTPPAPRPLDGSTIRRFDRVDEGVYRGGQPSAGEMRDMVARYRIRTVVKLNPNLEGRDVVPDGVKLVYTPLSVVFTPDEDEVRRILDEIDRAEKPVYVHCQHGQDRTGMIIALYRVRHGMKV
jgi:tyrosine-protein phosphatase SIW14